MAIGGVALGVIKRMIRRAYELDRSGAATLNRYRQLGYHISTQRFYDIRREVIASTPIPWWRLFGEPGKQIPQRRHIVTEENFPSTYKYVVKVSAREPDSGKVYTFHTGLYESERLTPEGVRARIVDYFREGSPGVFRPEYLGEFISIEEIQMFRHLTKRG